MFPFLISFERLLGLSVIDSNVKFSTEERFTIAMQTETLGIRRHISPDVAVLPYIMTLKSGYSWTTSSNTTANYKVFSIQLKQTEVWSKASEVFVCSLFPFSYFSLLRWYHILNFTEHNLTDRFVQLKCLFCKGGNVTSPPAHENATARWSFQDSDCTDCVGLYTKKYTRVENSAVPNSKN